jgi:hypothetical protein
MRLINVALFVAMFLLVSHSQGSAQAYLDPNTGSMAIQLLLAGVVGVLSTFRLYRDRLKSFFTRRQAARHGTSDGE